MITFLRDFTKTWLFKGLMILIAASFIGVAGGGVANFASGPSKNVIDAGDHKMTALEFKAKIENWKRGYEQQGQTITNEQMIDQNIPGRLLTALADQTAVVAWLDRLGIKPSNKLIMAEVAKNPEFFDSVTGRFSMDSYRSKLLSADMTDVMYEAELRDRITVVQYLSSVQAGLEAPRVFAATTAALTVQSRDASVFFLTPKNVAVPELPTDAELMAFYKQREKSLEVPETRTATVISFSLGNYAKAVTVSEDELRQLYESRRNTLATPEVRTFVQVSAPDMSAATKISAALKAGRSPEEAAKANKGEVISYNLRPRTAVADAKVGEAAFKMQTGEVSEPVQGTLGIAVLKMGEVKIGSAPSFESARPQLEDDLRRQHANEKLNEATNAFAAALEKGEDFDAAAKRLGLMVTQLEPMSADGASASGTNYSTYGSLVKSIFDLPQVGSVSEVLSMGEGEYFALKLTGLKPAGAPPFEQVRNQLHNELVTQKLHDALEAEGDKALARVRKGESMAAVAASYGAPLMPIKGVNSQNAQQSGVPQPVLGRVFGAKTGDIFVAEVSQPTQQGIVLPVMAIGRLDAIKQGDAAQANNITTMAMNRATQSVASDLESTIQQGARKAVKAKSNVDMAYRALGMDPPAAETKTSASKSGNKS